LTYLSVWRDQKVSVVFSRKAAKNFCKRHSEKVALWGNNEFSLGIDRIMNAQDEIHPVSMGKVF
jgi:hypothetical protein